MIDVTDNTSAQVGCYFEVIENCTYRLDVTITSTALSVYSADGIVRAGQGASTNAQIQRNN